MTRNKLELDMTSHHKCGQCYRLIILSKLKRIADEVLCQPCYELNRKFLWDCAVEQAKDELFVYDGYTDEWDEVMKRAKKIYKKDMRYMDYDDYIKSKHWQQTKYYNLERDKYVCQVCGGKAQTVHHKSYRFIYTDLEDHDCISVCFKCYEEIHNNPNSKY